jgi:membrane-associated protease RseP (regulator of RpoE activity)
MTDTSSRPRDPSADSSSPAAFPPPSGEPARATFYEKFRGEMVAGGAVGETPPADTTTAIVTGAVVLGLLVWLGITNPWMLVFVLGIIVSIFLHEVGHFVTARRSGMKVTQFYMGFGPKLWCMRRGEVEYGVRAFPLGAFVRIIGMSSIDEVDPADEARTYRQQSYPKRLLVITAGSIMHMIIAFVLLFGVFATAGYLEEAGRVAVTGTVAPGSPAAEIGLQPDDVIVSVDGESVTTSDEFVREIQSRDPGTPVDLVVERDGETLELTATLGTNPRLEEPTGYLGVATESVDWVDKTVVESVGLAVTSMWDGLVASIEGVVRVLNPVTIFQHLTGEREDYETRPTTLVGATQAGGILGEADGLKGVLLLLAGVNVFVGVFNMLPLLPFDGGHAAVATYERIRSRHGARYFADVTKMMPVVVAVLVLVGFLFLTGLYLDITKPL